MTTVGVIGVGTMGSTHLDVYSKRNDVRVVALADKIPDRLHGRTKATGNIEGQAQGSANIADASKYDDGMGVIEDPAVELVDICLPTPLHRRYAEAALAAGKHVLVEKPLARTAADAFALADAADAATGLAMPAMCMRFWPGWVWLKEAVVSGRYGRVRAATFRRLASHPGGPFYSDGDAAGGALLDLHIHDVDFIQYLFGTPRGVRSVGYSSETSAIDHVATQYDYDDIPLVTAEGGWAMAPGFGFHMQYQVNFEKATASFGLGGESPLQLIHEGRRESVELPPGHGYEYEIDYLLTCIATGRKPETVTLRDGAVSVAIAEAELRSIESGETARVELPAAAQRS